MEKKIGSWSFIIGVILALVLGLASSALQLSTISILKSVLIILGLIVGFLNVAGKETKEYLLAATVLVIIAGVGASASLTLSSVELIGKYLNDIFSHLLLFVIPATIIVALKEIYYISQSP